MRTILILLLQAVVLLSAAQNYPQILQENIKTLQIHTEENLFYDPIITLGSDERLDVSFDELSHNINTYDYTIQHCNADWTPSDLIQSEYLDGFPNGTISDYALSQTTTVLYTHYTFSIPNDDLSLKLSGNYIVVIYQDGDPKNIIGKVAFSVVDPKVFITADVRGNTDTELNTTLQQVDFDVDFEGYPIQDASTEIKTIIRQNNRTDNQRTHLKPTYIEPNKLRFVNNKSLIFEGGNEYHSFDISSQYNYSETVEIVRYQRPYYNAYLYPDKMYNKHYFQTDVDVNGNFIVNDQNSDENEITADYYFVNIYLNTTMPLLGKKIYIGGGWNSNAMDSTSEMNYDSKSKQYYKRIMLKQGGYNYQYWAKGEKSTRGSTRLIDGSFWQTRNKYTIYIYHRPWGGRYDKLIGVKSIEK